MSDYGLSLEEIMDIAGKLDGLPPSKTDLLDARAEKIGRR